LTITCSLHRFVVFFYAKTLVCPKKKSTQQNSRLVRSNATNFCFSESAKFPEKTAKAVGG